MDIKEGGHNPYVNCPYNKAHAVPKLRLQRHLLKCRKQYPHGMKACAFNATHIYPGPELKLHLESCPDRMVIEGQKYNLNTSQGDLPNPTFHPSVPIEEWEDEDDAQDFQEFQNNRPYHNNHQNNHHDIRAVRSGEEDKEAGPFSQVKNSSYAPNPSPFGYGRGRIHQLVAEMKPGRPL